MPQIDFNAVRSGPGDAFMSGLQTSQSPDGEAQNPLTGEMGRKIHRQLMQWFYLERDRQAENRLEMATDCDFYDNMQWDPEDAELLRSRGQMPLVYNEVAPLVDWLIGTERRARTDWKVLPRQADDVDSADVKTNVLKYISDVNRVPFVRSRVAADMFKAGVGWMDDGVRDDPSKEILYSRYEDWRNVLWDSAGYDLDLDDARYIYRWRWTDEDVAYASFPDSRDAIARSINNQDASQMMTGDDDLWYMGQPIAQMTSGRIPLGSSSLIDGRRARVRLIEAQFRMPVKVKVIASGSFKGAVMHDSDTLLMQLATKERANILDKVMMRVHFAVMTENELIALSHSIYRHNRFTLTPAWCYRRSRDRLPYGVIRRVRDINMDINKRASKALHILNTNQIKFETGAVADPNKLREEADMPDGMIEVNMGKMESVSINRDSNQANGQVQAMEMGTQRIQRLSGIADENMGRQTNAVSGEAIKARQIQGSVVTTEPFDNLRLAAQISGEKQTSCMEQFMTEERAIRLSGHKGKINWLNINKPVQNADGSVSFINDIAASMADFVISEQDYAGTLRQVMFDSLNAMATKLPPEIAVRLFIIAMDFSDMPNKDDIVEALRKIIGERDPNAQMSPEEQQQAQARAQQQTQAMQMQQEQALATLQEQKAKIRLIEAQAAKIEQGDGGADPAVAQEIARVRAAADQEIESLSEKLRQMQNDAATQIFKMRSDADVKLEIAHIQADASIKVAQLNDATNQRFTSLQDALTELGYHTAETDNVVKTVKEAIPPAAEAAQP